MFKGVITLVIRLGQHYVSMVPHRHLCVMTQCCMVVLCKNINARNWQVDFTDFLDGFSRNSVLTLNRDPWCHFSNSNKLSLLYCVLRRSPEFIFWPGSFIRRPENPVLNSFLTTGGWASGWTGWARG